VTDASYAGLTMGCRSTTSKAAVREETTHRTTLSACVTYATAKRMMG